MYTEFIIIYVLLAIVAILLVGVLVLQILLLKKGGAYNPGTYRMNSGINAGGAAPVQQQQEGGIAFCRRCATRFDAAARICPKCGTPRQ